ncbi:ABC transporter permease [Marinihelvus fidelis]|uniref:Cell division protein FtsX n=1 Tax=Marinihelvus fidelis TaxID=2613842 RepID=A0A5N0T9Z0_9GAMM|nr:permease-like cell division protein FtsX [Marinihelvus fidelis]KAA9131835.1 ABC transporter permease [Marinihelvus fidelis]
MSGGAGMRQRLRSWARRHSYSFFSSLGQLMSHRLGTLMTVLVIGIAMLLPLGLHVTLANFDRVDLNEDDWGALTVFMADGVDAGTVDALADMLGERDDVAAVNAISPEQGLEEFQAASGFGDALDLLESNPLPWVLSVTPVAAAGEDFEAGAERLSAFISAQAGVESVSFDLKWLQRFGRLLDLGQAAVTVLVLLFALAVIMVVANTIRLDVAARTDEIEIMALVGATPGFIRQPFLYAGFWYGLLGGVVALVLVNGALIYLEGPLDRLMASYGQDSNLRGLGGTQTLLVLLGGAALGWSGAAMAVQKHLRTLRVGGTLGRR